MKDTVNISIHIAKVPYSEEYYMGCINQYKAYNISIPKNIVPKEVLEAINPKNVYTRIQSIAIIDEEQ